MQNVEDCTKMLVDAILTSNIYRQYIISKTELEKKPEARKQVDEFRLLNFQMQNSSSDIDIYDESDRILNQFKVIRKDPLINDFLKHELALCKMLQNINMEIAKAVDLGFSDFIDEIPL